MDFCYDLEKHMDAVGVDILTMQLDRYCANLMSAEAQAKSH